MESFWIAIGAGVVSLGTLILSGLSLRHKAGVDYVGSLERRIEIAEVALSRCRRSEEELITAVKGLERRNASLLAMIVRMKDESEDEEG